MMLQNIFLYVLSQCIVLYNLPYNNKLSFENYNIGSFYLFVINY